MTERQTSDQEITDEVGNNVISFHHAKERRQQPPATEEELAEYRRMLPILRMIVERWPELSRQHEAIASNCVLAKKILAADP